MILEVKKPLGEEPVEAFEPGEMLACDEDPLFEASTSVEGPGVDKIPEGKLVVVLEICEIPVMSERLEGIVGAG